MAAEIIVELNRVDTRRLRQWLQAPNGSLSTAGIHYLPARRIVFEAVGHGGILVRLRQDDTKEAS